MIHVSSLDAAMLYAETPEMPMHTMGVLLLEPPPGTGASAFDSTRRVFEQRMHLFPTLRRRLVQGPMQIGDPHWIDDPCFDLDAHLLRSTLPAPGSMRQLEEFVGSYASKLLDRRKALWELVLVEGLEDGRLAAVSKFHHAAMDGGRLVALVGQLFDMSAEPAEVPPPSEPWVPDREPSIPWLAADTVRTLLGKPRRAARAAAAVATSFAGRALAQHSRTEDSSRQGARGQKLSLFESPPTAFNGALTEHRSVALADVSLEDLKTIKRAFDTTVNDVVLAACCASLRAWLLSHGGLPDRPLVATVPVAVRAEGDDEAGNRVSMIRAHLPVHSDDPTERLMAIHEETSREKQRHASRGGGGGDVFKHFTDIVTNVSVPWLLTHLMELYSRSHLADRVPPLWNLVISNVPGPSTPLYFAGAKLLRLYPLGPAQQGSGLNITVMSSVDRLCFGAMACTELVPDVDDIATGFVEEITRLRSLC